MGNTGMHIAVILKNLKIVKLLDDHGADATIKNNEGHNSIEIAEAGELKEIVTHFMS